MLIALLVVALVNLVAVALGAYYFWKKELYPPKQVMHLPTAPHATINVSRDHGD